MKINKFSSKYKKLRNCRCTKEKISCEKKKYSLIYKETENYIDPKIKNKNFQETKQFINVKLNDSEKNDINNDYFKENKILNKHYENNKIGGNEKYNKLFFDIQNNRKKKTNIKVFHENNYVPSCGNEINNNVSPSKIKTFKKLEPFEAEPNEFQTRYDNKMCKNTYKLKNPYEKNEKNYEIRENYINDESGKNISIENQIHNNETVSNFKNKSIKKNYYIDRIKSNNINNSKDYNKECNKKKKNQKDYIKKFKLNFPKKYVSTGGMSSLKLEDNIISGLLKNRYEGNEENFEFLINTKIKKENEKLNKYSKELPNEIIFSGNIINIENENKIEKRRNESENKIERKTVYSVPMNNSLMEKVKSNIKENIDFENSYKDEKNKQNSSSYSDESSLYEISILGELSLNFESSSNENIKSSIINLKDVSKDNNIIENKNYQNKKSDNISTENRINIIKKNIHDECQVPNSTNKNILPKIKNEKGINVMINYNNKNSKMPHVQSCNTNDKFFLVDESECIINSQKKKNNKTSESYDPKIANNFNCNKNDIFIKNVKFTKKNINTNVEKTKIDNTESLGRNKKDLKKLEEKIFMNNINKEKVKRIIERNKPVDSNSLKRNYQLITRKKDKINGLFNDIHTSDLCETCMCNNKNNNIILKKNNYCKLSKNKNESYDDINYNKKKYDIILKDLLELTKRKKRETHCFENHEIPNGIDDNKNIENKIKCKENIKKNCKMNIINDYEENKKGKTTFPNVIMEKRENEHVEDTDILGVTRKHNEEKICNFNYESFDNTKFTKVNRNEYINNEEDKNKMEMMKEMNNLKHSKFIALEEDMKILTELLKKKNEQNEKLKLHLQLQQKEMLSLWEKLQFCEKKKKQEKNWKNTVFYQNLIKVKPSKVIEIILKNNLENENEFLDNTHSSLKKHKNNNIISKNNLTYNNYGINLTNENKTPFLRNYKKNNSYEIKTTKKDIHIFNQDKGVSTNAQLLNENELSNFENLKDIEISNKKDFSTFSNLNKQISSISLNEMKHIESDLYKLKSTYVLPNKDKTDEIITTDIKSNNIDSNNFNKIKCFDLKENTVSVKKLRNKININDLHSNYLIKNQKTPYFNNSHHLKTCCTRLNASNSDDLNSCICIFNNNHTNKIYRSKCKENSIGRNCSSMYAGKIKCFKNCKFLSNNLFLTKKNENYEDKNIFKKILYFIKNYSINNEKNNNSLRRHKSTNSNYSSKKKFYNNLYCRSQSTCSSNLNFSKKLQDKNYFDYYIRDSNTNLTGKTVTNDVTLKNVIGSTFEGTKIKKENDLHNKKVMNDAEKKNFKNRMNISAVNNSYNKIFIKKGIIKSNYSYYFKNNVNKSFTSDPKTLKNHEIENLINAKKRMNIPCKMGFKNNENLLKINNFSQGINSKIDKKITKNDVKTPKLKNNFSKMFAKYDYMNDKNQTTITDLSKININQEGKKKDNSCKKNVIEKGTNINNILENHHKIDETVCLKNYSKKRNKRSYQEGELYDNIEILFKKSYKDTENSNEIYDNNSKIRNKNYKIVNTEEEINDKSIAQKESHNNLKKIDNVMIKDEGIKIKKENYNKLNRNEKYVFKNVDKILDSTSFEFSNSIQEDTSNYSLSSNEEVYLWKKKKNNKKRKFLNFKRFKNYKLRKQIKGCINVHLINQNKETNSSQENVIKKIILNYKNMKLKKNIHNDEKNAKEGDICKNIIGCNLQNHEKKRENMSINDEKDNFKAINECESTEIVSDEYENMQIKNNENINAYLKLISDKNEKKKKKQKSLRKKEIKGKINNILYSSTNCILPDPKISFLQNDESFIIVEYPNIKYYIKCH